MTGLDSTGPDGTRSGDKGAQTNMWDTFSAHLGEHQPQVETSIERMVQEKVIERIWSQDHTVWKPEPTEIANRLGWLRIAERMKSELPWLQTLAQNLRSEGYTNALLLGMGGSSLAPEVLRSTLGVREGYLDLAILDSTDPAAILEYARLLDPERTVYIVSTKSGGTVETLSFFKYFYNLVVGTIGVEQAGAHFIAITDPGSKLVDLAKRYNFREVFLNDPNIGGRYSALSYFGLVPAALIGLDMAPLLEQAQIMANICEGSPSLDGGNLGAHLGIILSELAKVGRDKLTFVCSTDVQAFSDWAEQLIAESTGKQGTGILPVVREAPGKTSNFGKDRLFVYLKLKGDNTLDTGIQTLQDAGFPVIRLLLNDLNDLGGQFFLWEFAIAVAGYSMEINPFNQPDVESAKVMARNMVAAYKEEGRLPQSKSTLHVNGIEVYADVGGDSIGEVVQNFIGQALPGAYIALQAYLQPTQENDASLSTLRTRLRDLTRLAVTSGYGPRFLHSTGQLHKGDAGRGLFIQFTSDAVQDVFIPDDAGSPDTSISFNVLKLAQALGDRQALIDAGRAVMRFHLGANVSTGLKRIHQSLE